MIKTPALVVGRYRRRGARGASKACNRGPVPLRATSRALVYAELNDPECRVCVNRPQNVEQARVEHRRRRDLELGLSLPTRKVNGSKGTQDVPGHSVQQRVGANRDVAAGLPEDSHIDVIDAHLVGREDGSVVARGVAVEYAPL